jgi:hypothetical protein
VRDEIDLHERCDLGFDETISCRMNDFEDFEPIEGDDDFVY